jgi:hypothetical protein
MEILLVLVWCRDVKGGVVINVIPLSMKVKVKVWS